jgi:H+/gluconate symporter-like permease
MDSLPGTPQIQNVIPTTFFNTNIYAAPILGIIGSLFILTLGMVYLEWRRKSAHTSGEGYGSNHLNEPVAFDTTEKLTSPLIAVLPLIVVALANRSLTEWLPEFYGKSVSFIPAVIGSPAPVIQEVSKIAAIWAVEGALLLGILTVILFAHKRIFASFAEGSKAAVSGALLASMNTASEYGFGAVIAALPGFLVVADTLKVIPNVLVNEAVTVTALAGITGSASGGLGIALAAMSDFFIQGAQAAGISMEVLHRVASMASGGMDTLPHNGAVITLLAVTGLTHKVAYKDIFAITCIKTMAVFLVIATYFLTGWV